MDVTQLLQALAARASWYDGRKILELADLEAGQGWERTLDRYDQLDVDAEQAETLEDLLIEHIVAGEKMLQFYRITAAARRALLQRLRAHRVIATPMSESFPCLVDMVALEPNRNDRPTPVRRVDRDDGLFFITSAIREYDERVNIPVDDLTPAARDQLEGYTQLIGIRRVRRQVFDVLWVPHNGAICIATDFPKGAPHDFCAPSQSALRTVIRRAIGEDIELCNLFPLIELCYESDWGKVVELGFTTDTASVKHERMRQKRQCLREELFHVGGKQAVDGIIHPFHVSLDWQARYSVTLTGRPELTLHGTSRDLHQNVPTLYDATFRHGLNIRDLRVVKSRLLRLMPG